MIKISFLGDIMCESPFLEAARKNDGSYDFVQSFQGLAEHLSLSNIVVGNLETPIAGEKAGYSRKRDLYSFNTPDSFLNALRDCNINVLLTANNHCFDRGVEGLIQTINNIEKKGFKHTGTFSGRELIEPLIINIEGIKIAIISCTEGTNATRIKAKPSLQNVNLLDVQDTQLIKKLGIIHAIRSLVSRYIIGERNVIRIKKALRLYKEKIHYDNAFNEYSIDFYIDNIKSQIEQAKKTADLIFVCPHMGGQFNREPGEKSQYIANRLTNIGVNAIVASHPHVIQKFELLNDVPCAFSLGNVSMSTSTEYINMVNHPDYGMVLHFYISNSGISKITFSIIKMVEDNTHFVKVFFVDDLLLRLDNEQEKRAVMNDLVPILLLLGQDVNKIQKEYVLYE